jgi:P-type Cu2+ transporter
MNLVNATATGSIRTNCDGRTPPLCYHCGDSIPEGVRLQVVTAAGREPVCCVGCQAVAQTILGNGLGDYYRHRERLADRVKKAETNVQRQFALYDDPEVQRSFVRQLDDTTLEATLMLDGMRCAACVWLNEHHLGNLPGVIAASVNYTTHCAIVRWDDRVVRLSAILRAVADIGYQAYPSDPKVREAFTRIDRKKSLGRIFVAGIGMMQVMMYAVPVYLAGGDMTADIEQLMRLASLLLTLPVVLYSAQPFFAGAWRELQLRHLGMDTPVALGIGAAFIASVIAVAIGRGDVYFDSITMFVFFLLLGRHLESRARRRAASELESATRSLPVSAIRLPDYPQLQGEECVAAASLSVGDHLRVRPGDNVAADGVIVVGSSEVNESLLSGESLPVTKIPGDTLIAGAVNMTNPLIMRVERVGENTLLSALARLAERAVGERPRIARVADKVANHFVLALIGLATVVGVLWLWYAPDKALATVISLLVVSCPCALSLAAPVALATTTGRLLHDGLLVTRGDAIEKLASATHFVFDKTGTLTEGNMRLAATIPLAGFSSEVCLVIAQGLQCGSEHPIARAFRSASNSHSNGWNATNLTNVPGRGIEGEIGGSIYRIGTTDFVEELVAQPFPVAAVTDDASTVVTLGNNREWIARFALDDTLRKDAKSLVAALKAMGKQTILLSGDALEPVIDAASRLGIKRALARMTPERKLEFVRTLQREGAIVAMIGDGINDAPVLAGADVSVALGSGTELAKIHADIVMIAPRLLALYEGVLSARHGLRIIKQNLAWAFTYNFTAIPLAALGLVSPWMAALGMSASSLLVVLNALRLNRKRIPDVADHTPMVALEGT